MMQGGSSGSAPLLSSAARIEADDTTWRIKVSGNAEDLLLTRQFVRLTDVVQRSIKLKLVLTSPADRFNLETSTTLLSGSKWKMSEDITNTTVAVLARVHDDGTSTFSLVTRYDGGEMASTFRVRKGEQHKILLGSKRSREVRVEGEALDVKDRVVSAPTLTISFEEEKPTPVRKPK
jgi:hypothetical protein